MATGTKYVAQACSAWQLHSDERPLVPDDRWGIRVGCAIEPAMVSASCESMQSSCLPKRRDARALKTCDQRRRLDTPRCSCCVKAARGAWDQRAIVRTPLP